MTNQNDKPLNPSAFQKAISFQLPSPEESQAVAGPPIPVRPTRMDFITRVDHPGQCDLHQAWDDTIFSKRPTTPLEPHEAMYLMAIGYWTAHRNVYEQQDHKLSTYFYNIVKRVDEAYEKFLAEQAALEAAKPPEHMRETHEAILARIKNLGE